MVEYDIEATIVALQRAAEHADHAMMPGLKSEIESVLAHAMAKKSEVVG